MSTVQTNFHLTMIQREILYILHTKGAMDIFELAVQVIERNKVWSIEINQVIDEIRVLTSNRIIGVANKNGTDYLFITVRTHPIKEQQ